MCQVTTSKGKGRAKPFVYSWKLKHAERFAEELGGLIRYKQQGVLQDQGLAYESGKGQGRRVNPPGPAEKRLKMANVNLDNDSLDEFLLPLPHSRSDFTIRIIDCHYAHSV